MYKQYLALNNLQWLACHPIYPTPPLGQDITQGQFLRGVYWHVIKHKQIKPNQNINV